MNEWIYGWTDGWLAGWMDGWMDGRMDGWNGGNLPFLGTESYREVASPGASPGGKCDQQTVGSWKGVGAGGQKQRTLMSARFLKLLLRSWSSGICISMGPIPA